MNMTKDTIIEEPPVTAVAEYSPIAAGLAAARAHYNPDLAEGK